METKTLSKSAIQTIDSYLHFKVERATISVPYFNNKTSRTRAALRTYIGKGSPQDIRDEFETIVAKNHVNKTTITNESLKKLLVDNRLGIECSGFAYHILEAESQSRGLGHLKKHLSFINCKGLLGKIRCSIRPIENCDVTTFASDVNSKVVSPREVRPGDIITMISDSNIDSGERNHILVIHEVIYTNSIPANISFSHAVSYPEDGVYGSGIRQGTILISDAHRPITEARWLEEGSNNLFSRAQKSKTEVRRMKWF